MLSTVPPPRDPLTEPGPWNSIATGYDEVFFGQVPQLVSTAIDLLAPEAEATALDVATGPGTLAVKLAPRVRRMVAIDFAAQMIDRLHAHLLREHITNLEAHVMDGQALTFDDSSFDLVASMFGVFLFADRAKGLKMTVVGYDPVMTKERAEELGIELLSLDELYARADFISVAWLSMISSTRLRSSVNSVSLFF